MKLAPEFEEFYERRISRKMNFVKEEFHETGIGDRRDISSCDPTQASIVICCILFYRVDGYCVAGYCDAFAKMHVVVVA